MRLVQSKRIAISGDDWQGVSGSLPTAPRQLSFRDGEIPSLLNAGVTASPTATWCDGQIVASMGEKAVTQNPTENPVEHSWIGLASANPCPNRRQVEQANTG